MDSTSTINFYETRGQYGSFSNFSRHAVWMKETKWPTSEHYFQAMKFEGTPFEEMVRKAPNPSDAAKLGRDRSKPLRKDWEQVKDEIMREVCFAKFTQHKDIKEILLGTGDATLVEHTVNDSYWGDGGDGTGKNMLGKTLMIVRQQIRDLENQKISKPETKKEETKEIPNSMAASDEEVDDEDDEDEEIEEEEADEDQAPKERFVNGLRIISAPSANANPKRAMGKKQKNRRKRDVFVDECGTSKMEKSNEQHGNIKLVGGDSSVTFSEKALPPSAKMVVHKHQYQRRWEPNERDLKRSEDDDEEEEPQTQRKPVSFADFLQTKNPESGGMSAEETLQAADSALEVVKVMPEDAEVKERCKLICGVMKEWIERTEDETLLGKLIAKLDELSVYDQ